MTPERLAEIEDRVAKASREGWSVDKHDNGAPFGLFDGRASEICHFDGNRSDEADADFIAHARADVPALVAEVKRLNNALQSLASHYLKSALDPGDTP